MFFKTVTSKCKRLSLIIKKCIYCTVLVFTLLSHDWSVAGFVTFLQRQKHFIHTDFKLSVNVTCSVFVFFRCNYIRIKWLRVPRILPFHFLSKVPAVIQPEPPLWSIVQLQDPLRLHTVSLNTERIVFSSRRRRRLKTCRFWSWDWRGAALLQTLNKKVGTCSYN